MTTQTITVGQNDTGFDLKFTITDETGAPFDLTGFTLALKAQKEQVGTLKFTGTMSIISAVAGTCKYTVIATDFDEIGTYWAEIEATKGAQKISFQGFRIVVEPDLPKTN
jgi:hypothetical protein